MARQASVLVCDELYYSITGKLIPTGVYTGDIVIPTAGAVVPQLVFLFLIEATIDDLFQSMTLEAALPSRPPVRMAVQLAPVAIAEGRTRWFGKLPLLVQQPALFPGRIDTKVIHDQGEILTAAPWISLPPQVSQPT